MYCFILARTFAFCCLVITLRTTTYYVLRTTTYYVVRTTTYDVLRTNTYYVLRTTTYNVLRFIRTTYYVLLRTTYYYVLRTTTYYVLRTTTYYVLLRTAYYVLLRPTYYVLLGREAITFYKRLADMLSQKRQHPYPTVMGWLRCRLSFASLRSSIMCIRGSRSSLHRPYGTDITLAASEGRVPAL